MSDVFTIPSNIPFIDALAEGLWQSAGGDSFRLADMQIFLPTRRACLALRDAFLKRLKDRAAFLPRLTPLGNIDEEEFFFSGATADLVLPPSIAPLRRVLLLARLIHRRDPAMPFDQATLLAEALTRLLDEVQINRCDFSKLASLVETRELAEHWQQTIRFLDILTAAWPSILADEGCMDPIERRNAVLAAQAALWKSNPPQHPIIVAGSTASTPATADFLTMVSRLPQGQVILPGLDHGLDETAWQVIDASHPQYSMKNWLEANKLPRAEVKTWPFGTLSSSPHRLQLLREALRPAKSTDAWRELSPEKIPREALNGIFLLVGDHPQDEARNIALIMREVLETPGKTATLVTPDRNLAERVRSELARWGVEANDTAGNSLAVQPVGGFLTAILHAAGHVSDAVPMLALLKHPLAALGLPPATCRTYARDVEMKIWRKDPPEPIPWIQTVQDHLSVLSSHWQDQQPFDTWLAAHIALAEDLASTDSEHGAARLWGGDDGEQAYAWISNVRNAARDIPPLSGEDYAILFAQLLRQVIYRPRYGMHPRLTIMGLLEARLASADLMILSGLNEGVWPQDSIADPWMSRPMRNDFGLPPLELRIGLSAHDFNQLASATEVILTRSRRAGNSPTVPSRFILQLQTVLQAVEYADGLTAEIPWQEWSRQLDAPIDNDSTPCPPPAPKPPVDARPKKLSVTEIGTLMRNPYAIYAKRVLGLRALEPLDAPIGARDRGNIIHKALEQFTTRYPDQLPDKALDELLGIGKNLFDMYADHPEVAAFWWPRFELIAAWFVDHERDRYRNGIRRLGVEVEGETMIENLLLNGRTDRIDRLPDGTMAIIDYKTGSKPTDKEVMQGVDPQLPLLGLIASQNGFKKIAAGKVSEFSYWQLTGNRQVADAHVVKGDAATMMRDAEAGLHNLINAFADPATPYLASPRSALQPEYDDYDHLARYGEWGHSNAVDGGD